MKEEIYWLVVNTLASHEAMKLRPTDQSSE